MQADNAHWEGAVVMNVEGKGGRTWNYRLRRRLGCPSQLRPTSITYQVCIGQSTQYEIEPPLWSDIKKCKRRFSNIGMYFAKSS